MIVPDASAAIELLLGTPKGKRAADIFEHEDLVAPELIDAETLSGLRGLVLGKKLKPDRARTAIQALRSWPMRRLSHGPFLQPAFELRNTLSAYDAIYVSLALAVGGVVVTADRHLARARVPGVEIRVLEG